MSKTLKQQILDDMDASAREEIIDFEIELRALAKGLAARLRLAGKQAEDVATDPRVIAWAHSLPLESAFAPAALCFLVEQELSHGADGSVTPDAAGSTTPVRHLLSRSLLGARAVVGGYTAITAEDDDGYQD